MTSAATAATGFFGDRTGAGTQPSARFARGITVGSSTRLVIALVCVVVLAHGRSIQAESGPPRSVEGFLAALEWHPGVISAATLHCATVVKLTPGGSAQVWIQQESCSGSPGKLLKGVLPAAESKALLEEVEAAGLRLLPVDSSPDVEDIYGLNTTLHVHQGVQCWVNSVPSGDEIGASKVKPSAEQKATFRRVLERVRAVAARTATVSADEHEVKAAVATVTNDCRAGSDSDGPDLIDTPKK